MEMLVEELETKNITLQDQVCMKPVTAFCMYCLCRCLYCFKVTGLQNQVVGLQQQFILLQLEMKMMKVKCFDGKFYDKLKYAV
jgi:hypothetical protein